MSLKYEALIRGALRQVARHGHKDKQLALQLALNPNLKGVKGGRMYFCNHCKMSFPAKDIQIDHIEPVVPINQDITSWDTYIDRLFCDISNLQALCKPCHKIKSEKENNARRAFKRTIC